MIRVGNQEFREVTFVDFEFTAPEGEAPTPICMVAVELGSGRGHRLFEEDLRQLQALPFPADAQSLVVAYYGRSATPLDIVVRGEVRNPHAQPLADILKKVAAGQK